MHSVGAENFEWVLDTATKWLIERVEQGPEPITDYHWSTFLSGRDVPVQSKSPRPRKANVPTKATAGPSPSRPRGDA